MTQTMTETTKTTARPESAGEATRTGQTFRPNVDILEAQDELRVLAEMPGCDEGDIDIRFEQGVLAIHGRVRSRQGEGARWLAREYGVGDFYRTFRVSEAIDVSRIQAEYENGVLVLHLPKTEAVKPRRIQVKAK